MRHRSLLLLATTNHARPAAMAALLVLVTSCCCFFLLLDAHARGGEAASTGRCMPHERDALLAFKRGISGDSAGLLSSWRPDAAGLHADCCRWRGVRCSNRTGRVVKLQLRGGSSSSLVGQISPSLLALEHLEHLDLSSNELEGPTGGRLPEFMGSFKNLRYLNLSGTGFSGGVPPQLGNLSKLQYLDLSDMRYSNSTDLSWLTRLNYIQYLNLRYVNLSAAMNWPHAISMMPSLRTLVLSSCSLASVNQSLTRMKNLTNLELLDLSKNSFSHPMANNWLWNITSLRYLDLSNTGLYGKFPGTLGDMTFLQVLDLSDYVDDDERNTRIMATNLKNLCNLEVLDLGLSRLHGDVTELIKNLPRCSPNELHELDLSENQLTGILPRWIGQFTGLTLLDLSFNNIMGTIPTSIMQFANLRTLDLSGNHLTGHVPYEVGMLPNLTSLCLDYNDLDGVITEEHFARSLQKIDLSYNALKIQLRSDWQPPPRLDYACFAACQMGPSFPGWLQWHVAITYLDISSAGIADKLPQWFSSAFSNVKMLNISSNQLNGTLPNNMGSMSLGQLYLSSNQLTGLIPTLPPNLAVLDLSRNSLSGPLPSDMGSANLIKLFLFSNQITGHIPESFCKYEGLAMLDLSNNFLEGELPSCLRTMEDIQFLALSNNSLSGEFPTFVQNFTNMQLLDLSRNKFSGRLPIWIGNLVYLCILRLSHNRFFGNIPVNITNLVCLQYMDLNNNEISGPLPSNLSNLKAMITTDTTHYVCHPDMTISPTSLSPVLKGQELNYGSIGRIFDTDMMSFDLSSNNLTGKIPEDITALDALVNLNLSWNHFIGAVPNKIGKMQSLESLDFSRNRLSGEIPTTLSNLTFLSYLDLSYNNLTGTIPSGRQLDTLYAANPSMYAGNIGLCGRPLQNNCSSEGNLSKQGRLERSEQGHGIEFYVGLGCGFIVGNWVAFGVLLFKRSWRIAYFQLPDNLYDKFYVLVSTCARSKADTN
ncbi:hypothetical protein ACP4OV_011739 [Aristida adscensionis]